MIVNSSRTARFVDRSVNFERERKRDGGREREIEGEKRERKRKKRYIYVYICIMLKNMGYEKSDWCFFTRITRHKTINNSGIN